jgi:SAM-dependent methyltransferase
MGGKNGSANKAMDRIPMDSDDNAARENLRARTAATSAAFLLGYLKPGMALLDCGCGEGSITLGLAELVAPGQVVGVDLAPGAIERARQRAADRGVMNVRFEAGSVYALPFPDASFAAVFSHALFEHLTDRPQALREIWRVLKPGGMVGVRCPDLAAMIIEPYDPQLAHFWALIARIRDELGGDSQMGRLCGLLQAAKFTNVRGSASLESYGTLDRRQWCAELYGRFALDAPYAQEWLRRGWIAQETLEQIGAAWQGWAGRPNAFNAEAWCEAVGWKQP